VAEVTDVGAVVGTVLLERDFFGTKLRYAIYKNPPKTAVTIKYVVTLLRRSVIIPARKERSDKPTA
jgi:hypothetical protein